ncbi:hypothetical protein RhiirC2_850363 [Rhizophagus irregularis]|uniref:Uncharacterized protein n=1 Tax=Rhizophagus irregularis TaxID=588596 RepID=A0A2N1N7P2_9GLOM|nr:hypothetical protein RhiirC2_850363 [Rhizophagus irregularis]
MNICANAPDSGWYESWYSKASGLYNGRNLVGSWTFARMFLTAVGIDLDSKASALYNGRDFVGSWTFARMFLDSKASGLYNGRDLVGS